MVHNTDDDTISLLVISNFHEIKVKEYRMQFVEHPLWQMLFDRFGCKNQEISERACTFFMSHEFFMLLHGFLNGTIDEKP